MNVLTSEVAETVRRLSWRRNGHPDDRLGRVTDEGDDLPILGRVGDRECEYQIYASPRPAAAPLWTGTYIARLCAASRLTQRVILFYPPHMPGRTRQHRGWEMIKRTLFGALVSASAVVLMAGPVLAHECTNASKDQHNPSAGAQLIFGCGDSILGGTPGGLRMFQNGDFPHGWIAFDIDCDGVADAGTYIVGPTGELPENAQYRGSTAHGVMNICDFFGLPPGCTD